MAAGLGFKTFNTGDVLSAADVNGYLMQGVLVFASTAARDAAITSPQEGQFAFTKDTNGLWFYDGAVWVASGATGDIEGVTAGTGISGGGTSGTVTITNSMATAIDAKGDLIVGTGADAFARVAVGADYGFLQANTGATTGTEWNAGAWTSWTPVVTSGTGSFTTVSGTGKYIRIGKLCTVRIQINITTNGTAATNILATLPFTATNQDVGTFREGSATGQCGVVQASTTNADFRTFTNAYPGGSGYVIIGSLTYEVA